ncbi:hypothetical protein [Rhodanobacter sp. Root561]|uniref:hypothetical protein n=1 Tax=Rhodanobacter sp. Root561 TaxID=1736560 RepID=UPI0012FCB5D6|nr:hypothetical protein [Rhodanobacter sp. Root561]
MGVAEGIKKPRIRYRVRGSLGVFRFFYLPGHMPSARTSVGNEEYEYEGKKERAASLQQAGNRQETVSIGEAAVAVALRHESTLNRSLPLCQQESI